MEQEKYKPQEFYPGTKIDREDIIAQTALMLEGSKKFPEQDRTEVFHITRAKVEIRKLLRNNGLDGRLIDGLESEIREDAEKLLNLFK